jgi:hypothetical protein
VGGGIKTLRARWARVASVSPRQRGTAAGGARPPSLSLWRGARGALPSCQPANPPRAPLPRLPRQVYFHKTTDDPDDYLVDHSIITYLIDPQGEFVTFYGKNFDAPALAASIGAHATGGGGGGAAEGQAGSQEGRAQR